MVVSNRNGSWGTMTSERRSDAMLTSRRSMPAMRTAPSSGSARRVSSSGQGGLARAGGPHDRDGRARLDRERDVAERRLVVVGAPVPAGGGSGTSRGRARSTARSAGAPGRRRVRRSRSALEDPEHPTPAGDRGLGLVEDLGELGDRLEEAVAEEDEADHRAGGQPGVGPERGAGDAARAAMVSTENTSPEGKRNAAMVPARIDASRCRVTVRLVSVGRARADAVGADDRGPHDQLGHRRQQLGVALAHVAVGARRGGAARSAAAGPAARLRTRRSGPAASRRPASRRRSTMIIVPSSSHAMPPQEKNWLSVSMSDVTRATRLPRRSSAWSARSSARVCSNTRDAQAVEGVLGPDGQPHDGAPHGDRRHRDETGADDAQLQDLAHVDLAVDEALVDPLREADNRRVRATCGLAAASTARNPWDGTANTTTSASAHATARSAVARNWAGSGMFGR